MSDLISRQDAVDILDAFQVKVENGEEFSYSWARMRMTELPSVTPAPEKCHNVSYYAECDQFVCSNCGIALQDWCRVDRDEDGDVTYHEWKFNYCPNCGAKVDLAEDEEDDE